MKRGTVKYWYIIVALICIALTGCSKEDGASFSVVTGYDEVEQIASDTDDNTVLIDLRDNREYESKHLTGAINVPYDEDGSWLLEYLRENGLTDKALYLMCGKGKKSADAFNLLVSEGYKDVHYVRFGFEEYVEAEGEDALEGAAICDCYLE